MKKKNFVVQTQLEKCFMLLETKESSTGSIVIRAKGTSLHFTPIEFAEVTGLNCVSNKDDFVFDEEHPNKIIEKYVDGANFIQKRELFAAISGKIRGKENNEDALKFDNLYFIHAFLLSSIDTIAIQYFYFDLVESGRYSDNPWGLVAFEELARSLNKKLKAKGKFYMLLRMPLAIQIWLYECCSNAPRNAASKVDTQISRLLNWKTIAPRPRYETLMGSMFNDAYDTVVFKNIETTRKEISSFQITKRIVTGGGSHEDDDVDLDDDFQDLPHPQKYSIKINKNHDDSSSSPIKKKLKKQPKGLDEQAPQKTPPPWAAKMPSKKQEKEKEFANSPMDQADKNTSPHNSTPMFAHDFDKNSEGMLNAEGAAEINVNKSAKDELKMMWISQIWLSKNKTPVHIEEAVIEESKADQDLPDSQITIPDELPSSLNAGRKLTLLTWDASFNFSKIFPNWAPGVTQRYHAVSLEIDNWEIEGWRDAEPSCCPFLRNLELWRDAGKIMLRHWKKDNSEFE
ncbi:hypothetical protein FXO37_31344 [Capsicum annuum]|nr:hypothetical protein FXO37_31344 [Capsicum annuum]